MGSNFTFKMSEKGGEDHNILHTKQGCIKLHKKRSRNISNFLKERKKICY